MLSYIMSNEFFKMFLTTRSNEHIISQRLGYYSTHNHLDCGSWADQLSCQSGHDIVSTGSGVVKQLLEGGVQTARVDVLLTDDA